MWLWVPLHEQVLAKIATGIRAPAYFRVLHRSERKGIDMELGNLSKLSEELRGLEPPKEFIELPGLDDARLRLVGALETYRNSRYKLGQALCEYKLFYRETRSWIAAANVIGAYLGCDERTVRRIVEDYERVEGVPSIVIKALEDAGFDPAARRNATMIGRIVRMTKSDAKVSPASAVGLAIKEHELNRKGKMVGANSTRAEDRHQVVLRSKIRSALAKFPNDQKLDVLIAALEDEICSEWGIVEPITLTINPRPSRLSQVA
jgi:hypothetical protein